MEAWVLVHLGGRVWTGSGVGIRKGKLAKGSISAEKSRFPEHPLCVIHPHKR